MFQQVSIAELVIFFVKRTRIDPDADRHLARRHAVLAHAIAQPVLKLPEQPFLVARDVAAFVNPGNFPFRLERGRYGHVLRRQRLNREQGEWKAKRDTPEGARKISHDPCIGTPLVKDQ